MAEEIVLSLEEALAPHLAEVARRRRVADRVLELIAADEPPAALGLRIRDAVVEAIEEVPSPSTAVAFWDGPVQQAVYGRDWLEGSP